MKKAAQQRLFYCAYFVNSELMWSRTLDAGHFRGMPVGPLSRSQNFFEVIFENDFFL